MTTSLNSNDGVEFLISTNLSEPLRPMAKIASGGKFLESCSPSNIIGSSSVETMIFDEIDHWNQQ